MSHRRLTLRDRSLRLDPVFELVKARASCRY